MPSLTVENYLKAAMHISLSEQTEWVSPGKLAQALDVAPGTVTSMLKTLDEAGLATYKPYEGVRLTESGRKLALRILRRHRLIEQFLVETLNLRWDQVHEEAEHMEHSVSDFLVDRIDEYLGRPVTDPHGAPIPTADGEMRESIRVESRPLSDCEVGELIRFKRVINQRPDFLRYLSDSGFELEATGRVQENSVDVGIVVVEIDRGPLSMGRVAAGSILVEPAAIKAVHGSDGIIPESIQSTGQSDPRRPIDSSDE